MPSLMTKMILTLLVVMGCAFSQGIAWGQEKGFPAGPVYLYVGYPPGGGVGPAAVIMAEGLKKYLKQPVIVEYKPGATQALAADFVSKSKPDGYTLFFSAEPDLIAKYIKDGSMLKFTARDFVSLGSAPYVQYILTVKSDGPWKNLEDLIAAAKKSPGNLTYGSTGIAGASHLGQELFAMKTGIVLNHIPFAGGAPGNTALLGGNVDMLIGSYGRFSAYVKPGGGMRALVVFDQKRIGEIPDVPTIFEKGYDIPISNWYNLLAPKGIRKEVKDILVQAWEKTAKDPQIHSTLITAGFTPFYLTPEQSDKKGQEEYKVWQEVMQKIGLIGK